MTVATPLLIKNNTWSEKSAKTKTAVNTLLIQDLIKHNSTLHIYEWTTGINSNTLLLGW